MRLGELAFACYVYERMSDYDDSYQRFLDTTRPKLNMKSKLHRLALIKWLNDWGCRQFAKEHHELAAQEIGEWYEERGYDLFQSNKTLLALTNDDFILVDQAYTGLVCKTASYRKSLEGTAKRVEVGPTGAAKILFALRPNALIPWDEAMRAEFNLDGSAHSYLVFLGIVKDHLQELNKDCHRNGFGLTDLPVKLGRIGFSVVKLVDEFFWITISRKCSIPSDSELKRWVSWL